MVPIRASEWPTTAFGRRHDRDVDAVVERSIEERRRPGAPMRTIGRAAPSPSRARVIAETSGISKAARLEAPAKTARVFADEVDDGADVRIEIGRPDAESSQDAAAGGAVGP